MKPGDKMIWRGSPPHKTYGAREVTATVIKLTPTGRVQIEIETPNGTITKFVSPKSLDPAPLMNNYIDTRR